MVLTEILRLSCVKIPLEGKDKKTITTELAELLEKSDMLHNKQAFIDTILAHDQQRQVGVGSGIAVSHVRCRDVKKLVAAIGITREPVEYGSSDGKPVKIFAMLVSPPNEIRHFMHALGRFTELLYDEIFRAKMEKTETPEQLYDLVGQKEKE